MYWPDVYNSFVALRDQYYRCKTSKWLDKYSKIEFYKREYKTFRRFCDDCEEYFWRRYRDEVTEETIQEIFERCLEMSQKKCLKLSLIWY